MSEIQLSTPARQALIGLLIVGGEATNPGLKASFSLEIQKAAREALVKEGLITAGKGTEKGTKQTTYHTLTEAGWKRGRAELTAASPTNSGAVAWARLLYGALNVVDRLMTEKNLTVKHVFSALDGSEEGGSANDPTSIETSEDRVLMSYRKLARKPGDMVSLVHLRESLADIPKGDLDRVLKVMDRQRAIQLEADPNRTSLPEEAREASIIIGGEEKHMLTIGLS